MSFGSIISVEDSDTDFLALQHALHAAGVTNPARALRERAGRHGLFARGDR